MISKLLACALLAALVTRVSPATAPQAPAEDSTAACTQHLIEIGKAVAAFRREKNAMPERLGDLVPKYLADGNLLRCPADENPRAVEISRNGAKLPVSYGYEWKDDPRRFRHPEATGAGSSFDRAGVIHRSASHTRSRPIPGREHLLCCGRRGTCDRRIRSGCLINGSLSNSRLRPPRWDLPGQGTPRRCRALLPQASRGGWKESGLQGEAGLRADAYRSGLG